MRRRFLARPLVCASAVCLAIALTGCGTKPPAERAESTSAKDRAAGVESVADHDQPGRDGAEPGESAAEPAEATLETWDVVFLQGARVGYIHTQYRNIDRDGRSLCVASADTRLSLTRFGQTSEQQILVTSTETPSGGVLEFLTEARLGPEPMICRGIVAGDELLLERGSGGKTTKSTLPWNGKILGFSGVDQNLAQQPLDVGQTRRLRLLMPLLNDVLVAEVQLTAREYVPTPLLAGEYELLEIESQTLLPGSQPMESLLWSNRAGEILKTRMAAFDQETFRTTREVALERVPDHPFDLGFDSIVKIDEPLADPHAARRIRYRIELKDGDPASVFINGGPQTTKLLGPHAIELTVEQVRPQDLAQTEVERAPGADDLEPNGLIQCDDPKIVELADKGAAGETDPWKTALALERFVHGHIVDKSFSHAFATAAEVAAEPEGDCTEHAVLLAALARARGIPARVATGLVYVGAPPGFGFHMWDELYIDGHWIPLDATLGRGGIGAGHIKLAHSNLSDATALGCFLPVAQVLGRLKIEVLDAE